MEPEQHAPRKKEPAPWPTYSYAARPRTYRHMTTGAIRSLWSMKPPTARVPASVATAEFTWRSRRASSSPYARRSPLKRDAAARVVAHDRQE